jgi:hypothetical protein
MRIQISPDAQRDLERGYRFFEKQRAGLGAKYRESVIADIYRLTSLAGIHSRRGRFFHMVSPQFHQLVFYNIYDLEVVIYFIVDGRRRPSWIDGQLRNRRPPT